MKEKIEGTFLLDGIIEGKIPQRPDFEGQLSQWIEFAASLNLSFSLEVDGGSFSILAINRQVRIEELDQEPSTRISDALNELLKLFKKDEVTSVFSTIRSVEIRKGTEVQTLFFIGPDGRIHPRERSVDAQTEAVTPPLPLRKKVLIGILGAVLAIALLGVSAFFFDYRALFNNIVEEVAPVEVSKIRLDSGPFNAYIGITEAAFVSKGRGLALTLQRKPTYPLGVSSFNSLLSSPDLTLGERTTLNALFRGYIRFELFNDRDEFIGYSTQRIADLRKNHTIRLVISVPHRKRLARVAMTY